MKTEPRDLKIQDSEDANIFKMTNVPSSRYQKSVNTIGFSDIDLVGKSCWMYKKSSFFTIFSMTKIEN